MKWNIQCNLSENDYETTQTTVFGRGERRQTNKKLEFWEERHNESEN